MEFMPFFRRPNYYPNYYQNYARNRYAKSSRETQSETNYSKGQNLKNNRNSNQTSFQNVEKAYTARETNETQSRLLGQSKLEQEETPIFEIFGIKLYFDDILLISLIFFLYSEGVEDNLLFIALILLLLSWIYSNKCLKVQLKLLLNNSKLMYSLKKAVNVIKLQRKSKENLIKKKKNAKRASVAEWERFLKRQKLATCKKRQIV